MPARTSSSLKDRGRVVVGVRELVAAERLVDHVDVVVGDRVVQRLEDRGVEREPTGREDLDAHQRRVRRHAQHADRAAGRQRVHRVHVVGQVVRLPALGRDRAGIAEGLAAAGRGVRALTGEVLVVDEDVGPVRPDEVGVVRVDAVGEERDPHALAGRDPLRLGGVGELERLGLGQRLARVGRAGLAGHRAGRGLRRLVPLQRRRLDQLVRYDGGDGRVRGERRGLGRRHRRGERVGDVQLAEVLAAATPGPRDQGCLVAVRHLCAAAGGGGGRGQLGVLVLQQHDHVLGGTGRGRRGSGPRHPSQSENADGYGCRAHQCTAETSSGHSSPQAERRWSASRGRCAR